MPPRRKTRSKSPAVAVDRNKGLQINADNLKKIIVPFNEEKIKEYDASVLNYYNAAKNNKNLKKFARENNIEVEKDDDNSQIICKLMAAGVLLKDGNTDHTIPREVVENEWYPPTQDKTRRKRAASKSPDKTVKQMSSSFSSKSQHSLKSWVNFGIICGLSALSAELI